MEGMHLRWTFYIFAIFRAKRIEQIVDITGKTKRGGEHLFKAYQEEMRDSPIRKG